MKKQYLLLKICVLSTFIATAQSFKNAQEVRIKEGMETPSYVLLGEEQNTSESDFFNLLRNELSMKEGYSFKLKNENTDQLGIQHRRFTQLYNGVELSYSNLMLHIKGGKVYAFNGVIQNRAPEQETPVITMETALDMALAFVNAEEYQWELEPDNNSVRPNGKLTYLPDYFGDQTKISLAYVFNIYASKPLSRELIYVDAISGNIIFHESEIHTGGDSHGRTVTAYSDTQDIVTDSVAPNIFELRDSTRGTVVHTLDCQRQRNYSQAIEFSDSDNFWDNVNTNLDEYAGDAHWATAKMHDYMLNVHNRNSIDDAGFPLVTYIHFDQGLVNAFWNGTVMTYGDGNAMNGPLTTVDIVGHEITHGLTDFTSDLIYANESGALNESFSDIFGTTLEFFTRPNNANWTVGEDIGGAFRSMINPNANGDPDTYNGQFWIDQNCIPSRNNDQCGVHTNSGVQNYWFYLLSQGGIGVNDNLDSFNVSGVGIAKAEKIAFRNLTVYLSQSSNHDDARFFSILAAADLYGACSPEVEATTNAWHAVGVGEPYVSGVSADFSAVQDTAFCFFPVTVDFVSEGNNVRNFLWDFGNGMTSTQRNPQVTYTSQGVYNVQLIGDGGTCGSDTVTRNSYIVIDTNVACAFIIADTVLTECSGRLFDTGGFGADYDRNQNLVHTIQVPGADFITLDFIKLDVEAGIGWNCNLDYIEIYDGPSTDALFLGRFCRNFMPVNNQIVSSGNAVTIQFISDDVTTDAGFQINWTCGNVTGLPVADFSVNTDSTCNGPIEFQNRTVNGMNAVMWDFGDGNTSTDADPTHNYVANGTYSVSLIATNSIGSDTTTKNALVTVFRAAAPIVNNDTICIGQSTAGLKVSSTETVEWFRSQNGNRFFTGDSLTLINLGNDTSFYVKTISDPQTFTGGKFSNAGSGNISNDNDYLEFDVHKRILLKNMILFSNRAGVRKLDLWNKNGELVNSFDVFVSSSPLRVNLNIVIDPDSNYRFSFASREINLFKNTSGATYPYNISNLVSITGSNNPGEYPYFYRWQVQELPCESDFSVISAIIDTSCTIVGLNEITEESNSISIVPNPFNDRISINFNQNLSEKVDVTIHSVSGAEVFRRTNQLINGTQFSLDLESLEGGVYYVTLQGETKRFVEKIVKIE